MFGDIYLSFFLPLAVVLGSFGLYKSSKVVQTNTYTPKPGGDWQKEQKKKSKEKSYANT